MRPAPTARRSAQRPGSLPELRAALATRLRAMECARDDRSGYTTSLSQQTSLLDAALTRGAFGPASRWIERIVLEHANQYLRAVDAWDRGDPMTPAPWRYAFALARHGGATQARITAVCAIVHLSYDLPLAVARPAFPDGDRRAAKAAYDRASDVLGGRAGLLRWLSRRESDLRGRRERAWDDAMSFIDARDGGELRASFQRIERRVLAEIAG